MAKIRVKNLRQVQTSIRKEITKALRDKSIRQGVGEIVVEEIQDNPVKKAGSGTRAWREYYEPVNRPLDPKYDIDNINFTFTGKLMQDLKTNVKADFKKGKAEFIIEHSTKKHPKLKRPKRKRRRKSGSPAPKKPQTFTYVELYEELKKINSKFDYLEKFSKKTTDRVLEFIKKRVLELLT